MPLHQNEVGLAAKNLIYKKLEKLRANGAKTPFLNREVIARLPKQSCKRDKPNLCGLQLPALYLNR